jgi:hypothetical protein
MTVLRSRWTKKSSNPRSDPMIPNKTPKFPVLVTAATQVQLDDPAWPLVLANWKQRIQRVRCLIPASAKIDEKHMVYVRQKGEQVMLADAIQFAATQLDPTHPQLVLCDPLVVFHASVMQLVAPEFIARRHLGGAWVATGNALRIDQNGSGEALEEECLRWFVGGANVWTVLQKYVNPAVPFTSPNWNNYFAGLCQAKLTEPRYFDVTRLKAVGTMMPPVERVGNPGYGHFVENAPTKSYPELVEATV